MFSNESNPTLKEGTLRKKGKKEGRREGRRSMGLHGVCISLSLYIKGLTSRRRIKVS